MAATDKEDLEKKTKVDLRGVLIASAAVRGQTPEDVNADYRELNCKSLPWRELGFTSLMEMLSSWTDICTVYGGLVYPVATEQTAHTLKLVQQQRKHKPSLRERKGRGRFGFFAGLAESQSNMSLGSSFGQALFGGPNGHGNLAIPVAFRQLSSGRAVGRSTNNFDPAAIYGPNEPSNQLPNLPQESPPLVNASYNRSISQPFQGQRVLSSGRVVGLPSRSVPTTPLFNHQNGNSYGKPPSLPSSSEHGTPIVSPPTSPPAISVSSLRAGLPPYPQASRVASPGSEVDDERPSSRGSCVSSIAGGFIQSLQAKLKAQVKPKNSTLEGKWAEGKMMAMDDWSESIVVKTGSVWKNREGRKSVIVRLAQYDSLDSLYFVRDKAVDELEALEEKLEEVYGVPVAVDERGAINYWMPAPVNRIKVGLHCVVNGDHLNLGWNRAIVEKVEKTGVTVKCVDFGTQISCLKPGSIHLIPACLAEVPQLAVKVSMFGWDASKFKIPSDERLEREVISFCEAPSNVKLTLDFVEYGPDGTARVNLFREGPGPNDWSELAPALVANGTVVPV